MINRRKTICGIGGEIAIHEPRSEYRGPDRRSDDKKCDPGVWVLHQINKQIPLGMIVNIYTCQMLKFVYDGNYTWTRIPPSLL